MKNSFFTTLIFSIVNILVCNTGFTQESATGGLIEISPQKPDNHRTPTIPERKRIPLGTPTVERTVDGKQVTLQHLETTDRTPMPIATPLTVQGCEGMPTSKEEAARNGSVCAQSIP